jgi:hypothetical protein
MQNFNRRWGFVWCGLKDASKLAASVGLPLLCRKHWPPHNACDFLCRQTTCIITECSVILELPMFWAHVLNAQHCYVLCTKSQILPSVGWSLTYLPMHYCQPHQTKPPLSSGLPKINFRWTPKTLCIQIHFQVSQTLWCNIMYNISTRFFTGLHSKVFGQCLHSLEGGSMAYPTFTNVETYLAAFQTTWWNSSYTSVTLPISINYSTHVVDCCTFATITDFP